MPGSPGCGTSGCKHLVCVFGRLMDGIFLQGAQSWQKSIPLFGAEDSRRKVGIATSMTPFRLRHGCALLTSMAPYQGFLIPLSCLRSKLRPRLKAGYLESNETNKKGKGKADEVWKAGVFTCVR